MRFMPDFSQVAVLLAAHGDRGTAERNAVLRAHETRLRETRTFGWVGHGVLNGEPQFADALLEAGRSEPDLIVVYPLFMSSGYFVRKVMPDRIAASNLSVSVRVLEPLGADPALPALLLRRALQSAADASINPSRSHLLIAAHGSKIGRTPAEAAEAVAAAVRAVSPFALVQTAFIEEPPFIADLLREAKVPIIVAGLFSGDGMHGHDDVGRAIGEACVPCAYTRPIGGDPEVTALIEDSVIKALSA